jgi:hypothetical protein
MRALVVVAVLAAGGVAEASKPIPWTMKGCVAGGVYYAIDKDSAAAVKIMGDKPLDVAKLEGKWIEVAGLLYPGDYFRPGDAPPVVKRDCNAADHKAIDYAKAFELRMDGAHAARDGKLDEALELVDASIKLVSPADCDTYIDRAQLYAKKTDLAAAKADVATLKTRKCRYRGSLNFLLLHDLGKELRAHDANAVAAEVLEMALVHCGGSDLCKGDIERDLAAARKAATSK